ncbi:MAG: dipeptidase PepE [Bacteroidetes bacterium]|nr:dipeptidase PepE [Bacteroidota bacterium]
MPNLLLLSNSTMKGEPYLGWPRDHIKDFLGSEPMQVIFIPFAGVTLDYDEYAEMVSKVYREIGHELISIHTVENAATAIEEADAVAVGGGNTFHLLRELQKNNLLELIRNKVLGGAPYMGWSAGSNVASPTICTTNDMPIVEPESFTGLNLIPFQLNPHYTEETLPNHGGESREQRLLEYLAANPGKKIAALPERTYIRMANDTATFHGEWMKLFEQDKDPELKEDGFIIP